ncbi:unnamed protein product [Arctogadus glacialis]
MVKRMRGREEGGLRWKWRALISLYHNDRHWHHHTTTTTSSPRLHMDLNLAGHAPSMYNALEANAKLGTAKPHEAL